MDEKCKQYTIDGREGIDELSFLNAVQPLVIALLKQKKSNKVLHGSCVWYGGSSACFFTSRYRNCNPPPDPVLATTNVEEVYRNAVDRILENRDRCQMCGSGYSFRSVVKLDIHTQVYKPLYIPLPEELAAKKAIINLKNKDDQCFKWCVTRALNPDEKHAERITKELQRQAERLD